MSKVITLLGSTGSIGTQSLDVCRMHGYEVFGLSANSSVDKLLAQIAEFHPKYVAVTDPAAFDKLSAALAGQADAPKLLKGAEGLRALACMDGAGTVRCYIHIVLPVCRPVIGAAVARHLPEIAPDFVRVRRKEVYDAEMNVFR